MAAFAGMMLGLQDELPHGSFWIVFSLALAFGGLLWLVLLRPLSSWLYARFRLKTKLDFWQASRASSLFSPIINFTRWHPLQQVRSLDESERVPEIMGAADKRAEYYAARSREWGAAPLYAKLLRASLWLSIPVFLALQQLGLPPLTWINTMEYRLMGDFYPTLNFLFFPVALVLVLLVVEARLGIRSMDMEKQHQRELAKAAASSSHGLDSDRAL